MPAYNASAFRPPAPVAQVTVKSPTTEIAVIVRRREDSQHPHPGPFPRGGGKKEAHGG
jgi:hypothetical protein